MRVCNCGHQIDPQKAPTLGFMMGLRLYNCAKCETTLVERTPEYYKLKAVIKARRFIKELRNEK